MTIPANNPSTHPSDHQNICTEKIRREEKITTSNSPVIPSLFSKLPQRNKAFFIIQTNARFLCRQHAIMKQERKRERKGYHHKGVLKSTLLFPAKERYIELSYFRQMSD